MTPRFRSGGRLALALVASAIFVWLLVGQQPPTANRHEHGPRRPMALAAQFVGNGPLSGHDEEIVEGVHEFERTLGANLFGVTTFIEVLLNQELGEPFRRDAMTAPVEVAGIDPDDMKPQQPA